MQENSGAITTFATAGGDLAVQGGTSGDHFNLLTLMIAQTLGESSQRVYLNTYRHWSDWPVSKSKNASSSKPYAPKSTA